tara:strand:- start:661 stop:1053 length:393 start_codon:yes stop_codon:yes gene_type:complete
MIGKYSSAAGGAYLSDVHIKPELIEAFESQYNESFRADINQAKSLLTEMYSEEQREILAKDQTLFSEFEEYLGLRPSSTQIAGRVEGNLQALRTEYIDGQGSTGDINQDWLNSASSEANRVLEGSKATLR